MHVNNKWIEENKTIKKSSETPEMSKNKDNKILGKDTKLYNLKMAPNFIIWINPRTSMLEMKVELQKYKFCPRED